MLVIVSNRLPVTKAKVKRGDGLQKSPGGLVSALQPILRDRMCAWVGWEGVASNSPPFQYDGLLNVPIPLTTDEIDDYYDGFCNRVLWPLYHDAIRKPEYSRKWWRSYTSINSRYAQRIAVVAAQNATVWVHDYHLQLVPQMLRAMRPDVRIGFFLHIPFPPQELFAQLPWRRDLLMGLLGADVIGFQTVVGANNFLQVCRRFAGVDVDGDEINAGTRTVRVGCFPISIDFEQFESIAASAEVAARREQIRSRIGHSRRLLLGVDRLDYTKGIDLRLQAFRELLEANDDLRESCVLVQVAVPSRELVGEYQSLRRRVQSLVGEINGEFSEIGRAAVEYIHRGLGSIELSALYSAADVMLVTPFRDGMNLVAKEYVASRIDHTGVLVLSEFTGAAHELEEATFVNPHDIDGVVRAMHDALHMAPDEQFSRMASMRQRVRGHDVFAWSRQFFAQLEQVHVAG